MVAASLVGMLAVAGCNDKVQYTERPGSNKADAPAAGSGGTSASAAKSDHPSGSEHPASSEHPGSASSTAGGTTLAGITFTPAAAWHNLGADGMRQGQYRLDPVSGDGAPGEVNIFYFGPASGGGVEANLSRWIGQMVMPDGSDPAGAAERSTFTTADGMAGHVVSLDGNYKSGGGRPMGGTTTLLEGYRLVGVVLEGPQGSLFFKLTGPAATARAMEGDLLAMVKAAHK